MRSVLRQRDLPPYAHGLAASVARPLTVALGLGTALIAGPSAKKESAARCHKSGTIRPLGSIDHCTICGKEYIVNSARQRYCKDCAPGAYRQADREASKKWNEENNYYELRAQKPRRGQKVCVICGKPISPGTPRITCSEECDRLRIKWHQERTQIRQGTRKAPTTVNRLDKDFMAQRKKKREEK